MSFWGEIKRRKMFQVGAVYAVVAWLLVQIVATVEAPLKLPDWFTTAVIVLLGVGFPITVVISWAFNLTPEGLVRDEGRPTSARGGGKRIEYALIGLLALAVAYLFVDDYLPVDGTGAEAVPAGSAKEVEVPRVAVLPCENLSPDPEDAYFAAGIHEEILNRIAKLRGLLVIARTSVMPYAESRPSVPQIARELDVQAVMECSVRYAGDNILVTAQLIDPETDTHLWSETYPGDLTDMSTVFALQADIATKIANALSTELSPSEQRQLEQVPTESAEAYALYLKATNAFAIDFLDTDPIIAYLDQALEADPGFAAAYAFRGYVRAWAVIAADRVGTALESEVDRALQLVLADANRALEIEPTFGFARAVLGLAHDFSGESSTADVAYATALKTSPNDSLVLLTYAHFLLRHLRRSEARELIERVARLDPVNPFVGTYLWMAGDLEGQYENAARRLDSSPTDGSLHVWLGLVDAVRGRKHSAERELRLGERLLRTDPDSLSARLNAPWSFIVYAYGRIGLAEDAKRAFDQFEMKFPDELPGDAGFRMLAHLGIGDIDGAFTWASRIVERPIGFYGWLERPVLAFNVVDDPVLERPAFVELRERLKRN